jgi:hypothetical protein
MNIFFWIKPVLLTRDEARALHQAMKAVSWGTWDRTSGVDYESTDNVRGILQVHRKLLKPLGRRMWWAQLGKPLDWAFVEGFTDLESWTLFELCDSDVFSERYVNQRFNARINLLYCGRDEWKTTKEKLARIGGP